jgi:hypothetical protein
MLYNILTAITTMTKQKIYYNNFHDTVVIVAVVVVVDIVAVDIVAGVAVDIVVDETHYYLFERL